MLLFCSRKLGTTHRIVLKIFVYFGTGRARSFELLYVDVTPREVVEIDGALSGWTAKIHLIWVRQPILDGPTEVRLGWVRLGWVRLGGFYCGSVSSWFRQTPKTSILPE